MHSHALGVLSRHATPEQRERYLRADRPAAAQLLASVGSETGPTGALPGVYASELERDGDGWRLTCTKHFASLAPSADWLLVWVAVPGSEPYPDRTVTVLVPRDAPEVTLVDEWDVMGMRPTVSWGVRIEGLHVPAARRSSASPARGCATTRARSRSASPPTTSAWRGPRSTSRCDWVRERPYMRDSDLTQAALGELACARPRRRAARSSPRPRAGTPATGARPRRSR